MDASRFNVVSAPESPPGSTPPTPVGRRFVGIHFQCCDVYARVYLRHDGSAYQGYCPRCSRSVRLVVAPGGANERFFRAG